MISDPVAATPGRVSGLHVFVSNPRLLLDLQFFLRRFGCATTQIQTHGIEVVVPDAPSDEQARREVTVYLEIWRARKVRSGFEAQGLETGIDDGHEPDDARLAS